MSNGLFRRLFGAKKSGNSQSPAKSKRKWSFNRSSNSNPPQSTKREGAAGTYDDTNLDSNKHAIAVAAATAAVAEAALAAAQAAAEVVRLTSSNGGGRSAASGNRRRLMEEIAAVKIQSAFRGYLARRALRALKALVKLQALVRGHIVRKQTADMLRRMQTLVRLQARARATRSHLTEPCRPAGKSSRSNHSRCVSSSNFRDITHVDKSKRNQNWLEHWMEESLHNNSNSTPTRNRHEDERTDKILEVDTWRPHKKSQSVSNINRSFTSFDSPSKISSKPTNQYAPSGEDKSLNSEAAVSRLMDNSPHAFSPSSRPGSSGRRGNFTPTKSESAWGVFNGYAGHPNYMSNTESFRAKLRSQSAPRQRLEFDKYGVVNRSVQDYYCDADTVSERGYLQQIDSRNRTRSTYGRLSRVGSTNLR